MRPLTASVLVLALSFSATGCQREKTDGPFEVSGRLVVFNYRIARASFLVTLRKIAPVETGATVTAFFDNPQGGKPVEVVRKMFPKLDTVALETDALHCIVKDRPYNVAIRIVSLDGKLLQSLTTSVRSSEDQSVLPAEPLVVGPFYDPNPKVFHPDGSTNFSPEKGCPTASGG